MVAVAEQALAAPDPWQALVSYLEYAAETMASSIGLRQLMMFATYGRDRVAYAREQMRPVVTKLVERAQEAGVLREDFSATDVPLIAYMLAAAAEYASYVRAGGLAALPRAHHRRPAAVQGRRVGAADARADPAGNGAVHARPRPAGAGPPLTRPVAGRIAHSRTAACCKCTCIRTFLYLCTMYVRSQFAVTN